MFRGLDLANGLTGDARCDGGALLLPLASQSGQERIDLRIRADGAYEATMRIRTADPVLAGTLAGSGFQAANGEQVLRIAGSL
jgi:general secretion pathway protein N